jgi:hypothetical protein
MKIIRENANGQSFVGLDLGGLGRVGVVRQEAKEPTVFQWVQVSSTHIASVGYAKGDQLLRVNFMSGGEYEYVDVPFQVFKDLVQAESVGKYFNANIKDKYVTKLLEEV